MKNVQTTVAAPKKEYSRPEIAKHGNIEALTQFTWSGPSGPIKHDGGPR